MGNRGDGSAPSRLEVIINREVVSKSYNNWEIKLTGAADTVMAASSLGGGWVTEVMAALGLKLLEILKHL
jgi:hypothetical protein